MTREDPSTSGQPLCRDRGNVVSSNRVDAERSVNNVCLQTGEEFSSEFLRDRVAVRRITVMNDGKYLQTIQAGVNINQNHQVVCGDLNGIVGLRRMDNEGNANASDFAETFGYAVEAKKNNYPDNLSRCQLQYGAVGQNSGIFFYENHCDQVATELSGSPVYVVESPQSYHPCGPGYAESPFTRKMKFLCSFGGRIFPRPSDGKLRYVGGETRIISIRKSLTWEELMRKTSAICNQPHTIKYQLPGEDLDALISVCSDEDLHHMIEEYQEQERIGGSQRLRIFLVSLGEPDSPNSLEGKTTQQTDADNQYVSAVNGMLDASPRKSSSGQTLTSHTTQMGRDSPTFAYISEIKDHSPNSSNVGGMFSNNANRLPPICVAGKSLNPSVPVTTFSSQSIDPFNSNAHFYVDWPCDGNGNDNPCVMDKFLCDHSYDVNSLSHYDNLHDHHPLMNCHKHNQNLVETDQTNNCHLHLHNCGLSRDIVHCTPYNQSDKNYRLLVHMERVLSDSRLRVHDNSSTHRLEEGIISQSPRNIGRAKSPSVVSSSSRGFSMHWQDVIDEKHQGTTCKNQPSFKMLESCNDNFKTVQEIKAMNGNLASSDPHWKHHIGNKEVTPNNKAIENKINYQPSSNLPIRDSPNSGSSNFSLQIATAESSAGFIIEHLYGYQLDTTTMPEFQVKNSNATKDEKCALTEISQPVSPGSSVKLSSKDEKSTMTEISQPVTPGSSVKLSVSSQAVANQEWINPSSKLMNPASSREGTINDEYHKYYYGADEVFIRRVSSEGRKPRIALCAQTEPSENSHKDKMLANQECINPSSKLTSAASSREATINDEDPRIYYNYGAEKIVIRRSNEGQNPRTAVRAQVVLSENDDEHNVLKSAVIVEDVTDSIPPGIPSSSSVVPFVQDDVSDDCPSPIVTETESAHPDSDHEDVRGDGREVDESISDAAMAEMEAGIYGLQIIKDSDLEELQELAFYGVVPNGPGGTMATVTEYMVNGSLRHVLARKDRILDRRKKLMLMMDAAFGMEYLHMKNIVHFDLKCDNLLVNLRDPQRPICKVGDFGLSRIKCNTLVSGGVRGTLPWMAPELLNGSNNRVSEKVDVYSFGIAMWEIITGEEPYANMHCGAIIGGILSNTLRPQIPERCDPEWRKLMEECWSFNPAARPSFTEITNRLRVMSTALQTKRRNHAIR
ncbi:protein kinase domain-containing protein [Citrus sinensis]|nr:protein kinase domain-containing protein [Citrus sinensis]